MNCFFLANILIHDDNYAYTVLVQPAGLCWWRCFRIHHREESKPQGILWYADLVLCKFFDSIFCSCAATNHLILGSLNAAIIYPFLQQLESNLMDKDCKEKGWCKGSGTRGRAGRKLVAYDDREDECGICLETCTKMVLPNCNHTMCINCYRDWYRSCSQLLFLIRLSVYFKYYNIIITSYSVRS
jgi:hypothetical protein